MKRIVVVLLASLIAATRFEARTAAAWRQASESELKALIPARAPVEKERIETEFRTASGITDSAGKFVAGVVLITAGYAAEGKYSNFLIVQAPIKVGKISLHEGNYVFGWKRNGEDALDVNFYDSQSGKSLGMVQAIRTSRVGRIESFLISPPGEKSQIQIGRFAMKFRLSE